MSEIEMTGNVYPSSVPEKQCTNCGVLKDARQFPPNGCRCDDCGPWLAPEVREHLAARQAERNKPLLAGVKVNVNLTVPEAAA